MLAAEKLAKKGRRIYKADRLCKVRSDWGKPANSKSWRSKIDEELWKRTDPRVAGLDDVEFINRSAEDEIRTEMDREASIANARTKLAEEMAVGVVGLQRPHRAQQVDLGGGDRGAVHVTRRLHRKEHEGLQEVVH